MNLRYNFRVVPESGWLLFNVVISTILLEVIGTDFSVAGFDLQAWAVALGVSLVTRTIPAAIIAVATDGFQMPGQPGPAPAPDAAGGAVTGPTPAVDEEPLAEPFFPDE